MQAVLLITLSAALHAAWNYAVRRHGSVRAATAILVMGSVAITLPLALAFSGAGWGRALPWGVLAGLGEAAYFFTLGRALEIGPLAAVYTVSRGSSMLLVWPASHLLMGEPIGLRAVGAVAALILGLWLLAPSRGEPGVTGSRAGYFWALACGLCIAAFQLLYKGAENAGSNPLQLFAVSMATSLPVLLLGLGGVGSLRAALRVRPALLVFGSCALTASFLLSLFVLQSHGAAWVMTLRNSSVAFAQLFGWALLGERPTARAGAGVALVFADAMLLGTG
jgi:drug/metabolite transporter (DMT)-like permease